MLPTIAKHVSVTDFADTELAPWDLLCRPPCGSRHDSRWSWTVHGLRLRVVKGFKGFKVKIHRCVRSPVISFTPEC